jgi:glycine cleavage system H protein
VARIQGPLLVAGGPLDGWQRPQGARRTGGTWATENVARRQRDQANAKRLWTRDTKLAVVVDEIKAAARLGNKSDRVGHTRVGPMYPEDLKYTAQHEWVRAGEDPDGRVRVGITDYAQEQLGDIVFVTLPEVGAEVSAGDPCGELESTKSVSDVYAPVSGTVTARNDALDGSPELVNAEPYGDGWMFEIQPSDPTELSDLLDSTAYRTQVDAAG